MSLQLNICPFLLVYQGPMLASVDIGFKVKEIPMCAHSYCDNSMLYAYALCIAVSAMLVYSL